MTNNPYYPTGTVLLYESGCEWYAGTVASSHLHDGEWCYTLHDSARDEFVLGGARESYLRKFNLAPLDVKEIATLALCRDYYDCIHEKHAWYYNHIGSDVTVHLDSEGAFVCWFNFHKPTLEKLHQRQLLRSASIHPNWKGYLVLAELGAKASYTPRLTQWVNEQSVDGIYVR